MLLNHYITIVQEKLRNVYDKSKINSTKNMWNSNNRLFMRFIYMYWSNCIVRPISLTHYFDFPYLIYIGYLTFIYIQDGPKSSPDRLIQKWRAIEEVLWSSLNIPLAFLFYQS